MVKKLALHTAVDTETINGKAVLVCSPNRVLYLPKTFEEIANFLISTSCNEGHHIWTFNLTYDVTAIFKFLPIEYLKDLYFGVGETEQEKQDSKNKINYKGFQILFIPGKFLSISDNHKHKCTLVDAAQFFNTTLDNASLTYLNEQKDNNEIIDFFKYQDKEPEKKTPELLYKYLEENKDVLIKYCKKDAKLTARLGERIDQSCYDTYGFRLETYTSNAKIGEKMTLLYLKEEFEKRGLETMYIDDDGKQKESNLFPRAFDRTYSKSYAEYSYRGGLFEIWQRGAFEEPVTDVDINSAYPSNMVNMPHWGNGSFLELDEKIINDIETCKIKITYGWVHCKFNCNFIPYNSKMKEEFIFIYDGKEANVRTTANKIFYPDGEREQIITLEEYYFMKKYGFDCQILSGFYWLQKHNKFPNPFAWIKNIYDKKTEIKRKLTSEGKDTKKDMDYLMCKIGMNGTYGKTVQKIGVNRKIYNPFYGSYITALTRVQIASFILDNKLEDKVLAIATDGILLRGKHNIENSEELGKMGVEYYDTALLLGNGMQQLNKKDKEGKIKISSRLRGVTSEHSYDIWTELKKNKESSSFEKSKKRPLHIGEGLMHIKAYPIEKDLINTFVSFGRKIEINSDKKRKWQQFKNFGELLSTQIIGQRWTIKEIDDMMKKNKEKEET